MLCYGRASLPRRCGLFGSVRNRIPMLSSRPAHWLPKQLALPPTLTPVTGNLPAKRGRKPLLPRWGWSVRAWRIMPWQLAWTLPRDVLEMPLNTLPPPVEQPTSSVRRTRLWRPLRQLIPMSATHRTSGGAPVKPIPPTGSALPANRHISSTSPRLAPA